ncbi:MAG: helix-turn-helix domain-containing protein [Deltaproteobacteria bacterium]|nr:helix-turn-helix domain-containing protein [Deltaproteobacteria bacterium]MBW1955586.1 helix-turn-helix domain-containing protein [Deltaproteobacteria bacterium]MBW2041888.1 helix-turn-helix domain-containing protein [Deltaproteobacteria bacterium]MBW2132104.1 helix-turn-helix domain-containing protein [Deltaproteobacteria bacterium]
MADETPETSFGRYLRAVREHRSMSIRQVSEITKIPAYLLQDIEREAWSRLPQMVYLKGFIRSYAEAVGADPKEAVRLYLEKVPPPVYAGRVRVKPPPGRRRFWPGLVLSLAGFAGIIFLSVWGMSAVKGKFSPVSRPAAKVENAASQGGHKNDEPFIRDASTEPSTTEVPVPSSGHLLNMKALSDTWVRVTIDDQGPKEYRLKTGDELALKALSGLRLHIENPAAVAMILNGEPFFVEGEPGRPAKVKFP